MKKDFSISDEWLSYEIHPETPKEGVLLAERFGQANLEGMFTNLRRAGEPYGIQFGDLTLLSNSRPALEASEFARDKGKFDEFHEKIFAAYFTETRDIGDHDVLLEVAEKSGLNKEELSNALNEGRYKGTLLKAQQLGQSYGVTGTPTIIINNKYKVVGAQPIDAVKDFLHRLEKQA